MRIDKVPKSFDGIFQRYSPDSIIRPNGKALPCRTAAIMTFSRDSFQFLGTLF